MTLRVFLMVMLVLLVVFAIGGVTAIVATDDDDPGKTQVTVGTTTVPGR